MNKAQKEKIKAFMQEWKDKGNEKSDTQKFWVQILRDVCGDENAINHIEFEVRVHKTESTDFKDVVINVGTHNAVLIEQKSIEKDLDKKYIKSGGEQVTPFEQAKSYDDNSAKEDKARWIITCNFREFWIYDMNKTGKELLDPLKIKLSELDKHSEWLKILYAGDEELTDPFNEEKEVSIKAGELTGILYDSLRSLYIDPDSDDTLKELNKLCVRLVFCLYAEDAGLFGDTNTAFHDYLVQYPVGKMNSALKEFFEVLNTPIENRDPYLDEDLKAFPYVNGGLFDEKVQIPVFNERVAEILLIQQSKNFDWSKISTTIFGAVFESTLNPETRRSGGMHYTAVENIHKVIDPLFLDDLKQELKEALDISVAKDRQKALVKLQDKIASLKFLDPACGSGNFLTETYLCLRRIENRIIKELNKGQITFDFDSKHPIKVSINQFYGIEINDFAVAVAQTALWIAESQMLHETEEVVNTSLEFFPLKTYNNIREGNALHIDWNEVVSSKELNYIMGNPPFIGARLMSGEQKKDLINLFGKIRGIGNLDYVSGWYQKTLDYINGNDIRSALVSTNSITQGEQVAILWKHLIEEGTIINFAYKTFIWDSEAKAKAHVHCVIIGFSKTNNDNKIIFDNDNNKKIVKTINPYLIEAPNIIIESRNHPICDNVPPIVFGSMANGDLKITEEEYNTTFKENTELSPYVKLFLGSEEFINKTKRYCLWLKEATPEILKNPLIKTKIEKVREQRLQSSRKETKKLAECPYLFGEDRQPDTDYLMIPRTSTGRRKYIPIGYLSKEVIASDASLIIPEADYYMFGVLMSIVHNAWVRVVAGRLKSDYRYSANIVYNNFPWASPTEKQKEIIIGTAKAILKARNKYPNSSLADMYGDDMYLYNELVKAHTDNDNAVMEAYGIDRNADEPEIIEKLFEMYQELT